MVDFLFDAHFKKIFSKIANKTLKEKIVKQFEKIRNNPEIGKPMKYNRRGSGEVYIKPYRLSYVYDKTSNTIIILDFYNKDEQ